MDELFNQIYGAASDSQPDDVDMGEVEKLAAQLQELGVDIDSLDSVDDLLKAAEGVAQDSGDEPVEPTSDKQAELQEKVAEADLLGRIQAHAYVEELSKLGMAQSPDDIESLAAEAVDELATVKAAELLGLDLTELGW